MTYSQTLASPKTSGNSFGWVAVTRKNPCPICGGPKNCKVTTDGAAVWCGDEPEGSVRENRGGQFLHFIGDRKGYGTSYLNRNPKPRKPKPRTVPLSKPYKASQHPDTVHSSEICRRLSNDLGVSRKSLKRLKVHSRSYVTAGIPERNHQGEIVGIATRCMYSGSKRFVEGGNRGLTYCDDWASDRWNGTGPIFLVEGMTDVAAGLDLGLSLIGTPNNIMLADAGALIALEREHSDVDREIIVVGERDQKANGKFPGLVGARKRARQLKEQLPSGYTIRAAFPPVGSKDLREFRKKATEAECSNGIAAERFIDQLEEIDFEEWDSVDSECDRLSAGTSETEAENLSRWSEQKGTESKQSQRGCETGCQCETCETDLEIENLERRQRCTYHRMVHDGAEMRRLRLDCMTWGCPHCKRKLREKWEQHFSALMGELDSANPHYAGLPTPQKIYFFYVEPGRQRERNRISTAIRRDGGNYIAANFEDGTTYYYATTLPANIENQQLIPADAVEHFAQVIESDRLRDKKPISTSQKWRLPRKKESSGDWKVIPGNFNLTEPIRRAADFFSLPVVDLSATFGNADLAIPIPLHITDVSAFTKAFADKVTHLATLKRNRSYDCFEDHANDIDCRRSPIKENSYRTVATKSEKLQPTGTPDDWDFLW